MQVYLVWVWKNQLMNFGKISHYLKKVCQVIVDKIFQYQKKLKNLLKKKYLDKYF